jgi:hypothetical protein
VAIPVFVVLCSFDDVLLTVLQHPIDESCEPMGHGCDSLRGPQFGSQSTVLGAKVRLATRQRVGGHAQGGGRTVDHMACASPDYLVAGDAIVGAQSQPGNEVPFCFPTTHIKPDFGQDRLRDHDVDSIDPR